MVEQLNPKSTGNIGHFEVVPETGSVLFQTALWGCFGGCNLSMVSFEDLISQLSPTVTFNDRHKGKGTQIQEEII